MGKLNISDEKTYTSRLLASYFLIEDLFYLVFGWSYNLIDDADTIYTLNLSNPVEWNLVNTKDCQGRSTNAFSLVPNEECFMFAGSTFVYYRNELYKFNIENSSCYYIHQACDSPPARMYHSMAIINTYIYGGENGKDLYEDLWRYDVVTLAWTLEKVLASHQVKGHIKLLEVRAI